MKIQATEPDGTTTTVVDTNRAIRSWSGERNWDGHNWIHRPTRSQWVSETLYQSRAGRYYIVTESAYQGSLPAARFVDEREAAEWMVLNEHDLPEELKPHDSTEQRHERSRARSARAGASLAAAPTSDA